MRTLAFIPLCLAVLSVSLHAQPQFHGGVGLIGGPITFTLPNDGSTGTVINQLAKINSAGNAVTANTGDTSVPVYVVVAGAGTTGNATLAFGGTALCRFDAGGATAGHFVATSTATSGRCMDAGATAPTSGWVIGIAGTAAANANGTVTFTAGYNAAAGGSGGTAVAPYTTTVTAQTSVSITAVTHGQATLATAQCFDNSSPRLAVACAYTRNSSGDLVFSFNPAFTGLLEIGSGGGVSISPFSATVTAQTSVSVTAVTHGKGVTPAAVCLDNSSPKLIVACSDTRNGSGDLVFAFNPAFTGTIEVRP